MWPPRPSLCGDLRAVQEGQSRSCEASQGPASGGAESTPLHCVGQTKSKDQPRLKVRGTYLRMTGMHVTKGRTFSYETCGHIFCVM